MNNTMFFDGGFSGGLGTYGFIINNTPYNGVIEECQSSTEAEYIALILGLNEAIRLGIHNLTIKGDSRVVLHQLTGQVKVRQTHSLHREAMCLLSRFTWTVEWIPSRKNPADKLTAPESI
jgi:ribonuclease HI